MKYTQNYIHRSKHQYKPVNCN